MNNYIKYNYVLYNTFQFIRNKSKKDLPFVHGWLAYDPVSSIHNYPIAFFYKHPNLGIYYNHLEGCVNSWIKQVFEENYKVVSFNPGDCIEVYIQI